MGATYALINKVLLKFHTDLLRFLFLFHGLFFFYFHFLIFNCFPPPLLFQRGVEVSSPGQWEYRRTLKGAWKTSSKDL